MTSRCPRDIMLAHQFLYYVESRPVWDDNTYDLFCQQHGLDGKGGSDMASSYPEHIRELAKTLRA